jgi:hypothetical protein
MRMRPTDEEIEKGQIYVSVSESPGAFLYREAEAGAIYRSEGTKICEYTGKKNFVLKTVDGSRLFVVKRKGWFPARFEVTENGKAVAVISTRSVLRTKYLITLGSGETWTVRIPLFTIYFAAASTKGRKIWIMVARSARQWNILLPDGDDAPELLCAVVFVQRRWV